MLFKFYQNYDQFVVQLNSEKYRNKLATVCKIWIKTISVIFEYFSENNTAVCIDKAQVDKRSVKTFF